MTPSPPSGRLPLDVATRFAHVLVHDLAESLGLRALSIKGPVNLHYEIVPPYDPSDADVLVAPEDFHRLLLSLRELGWTVRPEEEGLPRMMRAHSVTLIHPDWPCDIDLHESFPGLLTPPEHAFDALWRRRATMCCAGHEITIPDFDGAFVICLLHAYRDRFEPAKKAVVERLVALGDAGRFAGDEGFTLAALLRETGAFTAMDDLLAERIAPPVSTLHPVDEELLFAWRVRVSAGIGMLPPILWTAISGRPFAAARMLGTAFLHRLQTENRAAGRIGWETVRSLAPSLRRAPAVVLRTVSEIRAASRERHRRRASSASPDSSRPSTRS